MHRLLVDGRIIGLWRNIRIYIFLSFQQCVSWHQRLWASQLGFSLRVSLVSKRLCSDPPCPGAVWRDPLHTAQPGRVLEVWRQRVRPAGGLPLQPGVHGRARPAVQRPDLSARRRRSHQHAVAAQLRLVKETWLSLDFRKSPRNISISHQQETLIPFSYSRNPEQNKCLWKLSDISEKSDNEGTSSSSLGCGNISPAGHRAHTPPHDQIKTSVSVCICTRQNKISFIWFHIFFGASL